MENYDQETNKKIIIAVIAVIVVVIIGYVIFQKTNEPENIAQKETVTPTDMNKTASTNACINPTTGASTPAVSGQTCPSGMIAYGGGSGRDGANGANGSSGSNGSGGSNGSNGRDGTSGSNGSNGSKGADGANGGTGPAGPAGPAGPPGPQGPAGQNGTNGGNGGNGGGGYYGAYADNTTPKTTTGHSPQYLDGEIYTDISAELTLAVDYATVVLTTGGSGIGNFLDGITGGIVYGDHIWKVTTNNSGGYELALKQMTGAKTGGETDGALTLDSSFEFLPITGAGTPQSAWPSLSAGETGFGYSITATTSTLAGGWTANYWNAVTASNVKLLDKTSASAEDGDTMNLRWKAEFKTGGGQYLKNGTYNEFVTLTASTQ